MLSITTICTVEMHLFRCRLQNETKAFLLILKMIYHLPKH